MTEHMSHQEYVDSVRVKSGVIAKEMLDGRRSFLDGAIELYSLLRLAEVGDDDSDLLTFTGVVSETDHLPVRFRDGWDPVALARKDLEIEQAEMWAKSFSYEACKSVATRFAPNPSFNPDAASASHRPILPRRYGSAG